MKHKIVGNDIVKFILQITFHYIFEKIKLKTLPDGYM